MAQNDLAKMFGGGGDTPSAKSAIPQYNGGGTSAGRAYTGENLRLPQPNNALASLGEGIMRGAGALAQMQHDANQLELQQQEKLDRMTAANALAKYHAGVNTLLPEYERQFPVEGDTQEYLPGLKKSITDTYEGVYNTLQNDEQKRLFMEQSHGVTLGGFAAGQKSYFSIRDAQIQKQQNEADPALTAALINNPILGENPAAAYAQYLSGATALASGLDPVASMAYIQKKKEEGSAAVFAALAGKDPVNGTGAEAALAMLTSGQVLDLPGDAQVKMISHVQQVLTTAKTRQTANAYNMLKDQSAGTIGAIMNGQFSAADRKAGEGMLQMLLASPYATVEQQQWARHELNVWKYADMAKTLNPANKYEYERNIEQFNPNNPAMFRYKDGDPEAARQVYTVLKELGGFYQQTAQTGVNVSGQTMNLAERMRAGIGPKLTGKEINDATLMFMNANAAGQGEDQVSSLIGAYQQFSNQLGNDPRLVVAGMQQLYGNDALHMNKQRLLALQVSGDAKLQRHLVQIAGVSLSDLTKGWDKNVMDSAGRAKDPTAFSKLVVNNATLAGIRNNPALGIVGEQMEDMQELITKAAATYVNQGMGQEAAVKKAVDDIIPGKQRGNTLIGHNYDADTMTRKLGQLKSNATRSTDVMNPLRTQMFGPSTPGNLLTFAHQNGLGITDGFATGGHNAGSDHYKGSKNDPHAIDIDPTSIKDYGAFVRQATAAGYVVRDERTKPKGQAVWTGPHIHLSKNAQVIMPHQRVRAEQALKTFQSNGYFITDPSAPGQAVMPVYLNGDGRPVPLADVNGKRVTVWLKDLQGYREQLSVPMLPTSISSGRGYQFNMTGK